MKLLICTASGCNYFEGGYLHLLFLFKTFKIRGGGSSFLLEASRNVVAINSFARKFFRKGGTLDWKSYCPCFLVNQNSKWRLKYLATFKILKLRSFSTQLLVGPMDYFCCVIVISIFSYFSSCHFSCVFKCFWWWSVWNAVSWSRTRSYAMLEKWRKLRYQFLRFDLLTFFIG